MNWELDVQTSEYAGLGELADALNNGTCGAILLNKAYLDVIAEMDQYGSVSIPDQRDRFPEGCYSG